MRVIGTILLILGIIFFINAAANKDAIMNSSDDTYIVEWMDYMKKGYDSDEATKLAKAEKEKELESKRKEYEFCEGAKWPCVIIGGIFLVVGSINSLKSNRDDEDDYGSNEKSRVCMNCGSVMNESQAYCHNCGRGTSAFCPYCGMQVDVSSAYCRECGRSLR